MSRPNSKRRTRLISPHLITCDGEGSLSGRRPGGVPTGDAGVDPGGGPVGAQRGWAWARAGSGSAFVGYPKAR